MAAVVLKYALNEVMMPARGTWNAKLERVPLALVISIVVPNSVSPCALLPKPTKAGRPARPPAIVVRETGRPDALRPHGTYWARGTCGAGNPSGALGAYITLGACRADRASRTGRPLGTHVPLRTLTARIALGAHIPADTLDTLDALRPCVAPGAIAASRPRVSGRSYRSCISSGSPCAGCTGKSLGADRAGFPSVALGTGTTGIALDSLRARRPLVALRPGRPTLTAGGMALILVAVARIALIHLKHFLSFFKKGTYHVFFYK